jgi:hypothetical protein
MGAKAKIAIVVLLIIIVVLAIWQFTSPAQLPPIGNKYTTQSIYTNRGTWIILENMTDGRAYLAFSIANESYPRTEMQTFYTLTISNLNQTLAAPYAKGFGLRITSVTIQDSIDGSKSSWGIGSDLTDAVMPRIMSMLPKPDEEVRQVLFRPEPKLYSDLRIRVMDLGWNLDALLEIQINRLMQEEEAGGA